MFLQVRLEQFHESLAIILKELKVLERDGFAYNLGTDDEPDYVTMYPFPLRYTVDYPEGMTILGLAASNGNYPHPNYRVPAYTEKNDVDLGMGLDCPDIPRHYPKRTEQDHMAALRAGNNIMFVLILPDACFRAVCNGFIGSPPPPHPHPR
jgi:hypothetical protein